MLAGVHELAVLLVDSLDVIREPILEEVHQLGSDAGFASLEVILKRYDLVGQRPMFSLMGGQTRIFFLFQQFFFRREVLDGVVNQATKEITGNVLALAGAHGSVEFVYDFE